MAADNPPDWKTMSRAELDLQYRPSCWSKKLARDVIVDAFIKDITEATAKVKGQYQTSLDVPYGTGSPEETVDIYYPSQECTDDQSLLIFIHGGSWTELGKEHYGLISYPFIKQGITVALVQFDNAPKGTMTTIVDQCRRACLHLARTFPDKRLYLCGHSAGAHLCACVLSTDWSSLGADHLTFHGAALISGIYDLAPIQSSYVNEPLNLTESEVDCYSPQRLLSKLKANLHADFRCLLAHGEQEPPEFKRQEKEYSEGLVSVGVECLAWEVDDEDHFSEVIRFTEQEYSLSERIVKLIKTKQL